MAGLLAGRISGSPLREKYDRILKDIRLVKC